MYLYSRARTHTLMCAFKCQVYLLVKGHRQGQYLLGSGSGKVVIKSKLVKDSEVEVVQREI